MLHPGEIGGGVVVVYRDVLGRNPSRSAISAAGPGNARLGLIVDFGKIGLHCYSFIPRRSCHSVKVRTASLCTWMNPWIPAARSASTWSLGLPATRTGACAFGQTSCASFRYSGSELHSTIRSAGSAV